MGGGAGLILLAALSLSSPVGWQEAALGLDALSRGEVEAAVRHLKAAQRELPESGILARDLALALAQAGDLVAAKESLQRAEALGHPDLALAQALVLASLGETEAALAALEGADGFEAASLAATLGDRGAVRALARRLDEGGGEGTLVRLVLARDAAVHGDPGRARVLAEAARHGAERQGDALVYNAARDLSLRLEPALRPRVDLRLAILGGAIGNPDWAVEAVGRAAGTLRLQGAVSGRLGLVSGAVVAHIEQRGVLEGRGDRTLLEVGGSLEIPFSADLESALFGVSFRILDTRSGLLDRRLASGLEGGPHLRIALAPGWWGQLAVQGVWTDFDERTLFGFDRDRIGQRATLSVHHASPRWSGHLALQGLNDEAVSDAFDALGVGLTARARFSPGGRWSLEGGLQTMLRRFGPVGDEAVIGSASQRLELRWGVDLQLRRPLWGPLWAMLEGAVVRSEARSGHRYAGGRWAAGLEGQW